MRTPFRLLLKLFQNRFFENDTVAPGGGFQTSIHQVLGFLITLGLCVAYLAMPQFLALGLEKVTPQTEWLLRMLRLFFTAYSFGLAGFTALFYWDVLFPDRRDFLILAPFPIRLRELIGAKFLALVSFLMLLAAAMNLAPDLLALAAIFVPKMRGAGIRLAATQLFATGSASVFAFLLVIALQGILMNVTSPRIFRRISPWLQMAGMSLMVATILGFPVYSALLKRAVERRQAWLYLFPPVWFSGLYELLPGGSDHVLQSLGRLSLAASALALLTVLLTWGLGFRRHFRRTLEAEDALHRPRAWRIPHGLVRSPLEHAIFGFIGRTLARSERHQFFLATYLSAGLCVAAFFGIAVRDGMIALSPGGSRAVAFVIGFFLISGFRAAFQFPADLNANWIFRMREARWTELSRRATRKLVLVFGLFPALLLALPLESAVWHWPVVLEHAAVQLVAAALLVEAMFWTFDKVPFTCSYFPGRTSMALLFVLYVYGTTGYSFNMGDLESAIERRWLVAILFFSAAAVALAYAWRRAPRAEAVRFDGSEPVIQTLDLS